MLTGDYLERKQVFSFFLNMPPARGIKQSKKTLFATSCECVSPVLVCRTVSSQRDDSLKISSFCLLYLDLEQEPSRFSTLFSSFVPYLLSR